jgi:hypothetical protein
VVATFAHPPNAARLAGVLRRAFGLDHARVSTATVAAHGEPHDGHALLAAWVADALEEEVATILEDGGATLHPQPGVPPTSEPQGATRPAGAVDHLRAHSPSRARPDPMAASSHGADG